MKILWLFNHPAPYKVDFFNELGKKTNLTVLFERASESDRNRLFYHSKATHFKPVFLKSISLGSHNNIASGFLPFLRDRTYDIIVINGWSSFTEMKAIRYLKKRKISYVFAINGGIVPKKESFWKRKLKTKMIGGANNYLCPDLESEEYLLHYGGAKDAIALFPYSTLFEKEILEKPLSKEEKEERKKKLGLPAKPIYIAVGAFIERKNISFLLSEIWTHVSKEKELFLIGEGPLKEAYSEIIKEKSLKNVHLLPFQSKEKILDYLSVSEMSLFLTKEDIYGHVVNESLSQGCPVLGSDCSNAAKHLIKNGEDGYVFPLRDKNDFVAILEKEIPFSMRLEAIRVAKENTLEKMALTHLSFFERILSK